MNDKVLYTDLTPQEFRERLAQSPIAYLPLGTLEWHGEHLPLGADGLQSQGFFIELARAVGGIVLPMLFMGPDRRIEQEGRELYGMDYTPHDKPQRYPDQQRDGSAYWMPTETFQALLEAILKQLARAGFKIVVGHGHGPSTKFFRDHADLWQRQFGLETMVCWVDCHGCTASSEEREVRVPPVSANRTDFVLPFDQVADKKSVSTGASPPPYKTCDAPDCQKWNDLPLGIQVDHAGANETSLMMCLRPDLVQMVRLPTDLNQWPVAIAGADPRQYANVEYGRRAIECQKSLIAGILRTKLANRRDIAIGVTSK